MKGIENKDDDAESQKLSVIQEGENEFNNE
jgi:hypothetical protein